MENENKELDFVISLLKKDIINKNNSIFPNIPIFSEQKKYNTNSKNIKENIPKINSKNKPLISFKKFKDLPEISSTNSFRQNHFISNPPNIFKNISNNISKSLLDNNIYFQSQRKNLRTSPQPFNLKIRYLNFRPYVDIPTTIINGNENKKNNNSFPLKPQYFFKMLGNECLLVRNLLEDNGFVQTNSNDFSILWQSGHIKINLYSEVNEWQKLNHFPRSNELTRKDLLYKNVTKLKYSFPNNKFNFIPESFILPNEHKFLEDEMSKNLNELWIIKPVAMSQGRGIFLTNKINDIPSGYNMIASKYISNPYLINNKKFDLRVYVFVSSIMPLRIYRYKEGLVRFASDEYSSDYNDRCSHLTNYAVNKNNKNYKMNHDPEETDFNTSKWNFAGLKNYFLQNQIDYEQIFNKIDDIIIKTFISCENSLLKAVEKNCKYRNTCFELFGFDILFDKSLNPWLIEVNLSPNLHYDAPIDLKIKGEMIAEIFDLIRVVPYDLRNEYYGNGFNIGLITKTIKELQTIKMNKEMREMIWDTNEEYQRVKKFKRIFPTEKYFEYRKYFDKEREINLILGLIEFDKSKKVKKKEN